ncbi:copper transporter [Aspergillus steynii IBT 23096]|uniref:Copper transport protein n=1 Tax=Aspergillus steynii IBT 23096 TaxID=1392250 RepID=A0A2I2FY64_9EURO|nr:copper transporter [Aspergillus steynii IBT 23096]PLB45569.1 copper transporter [Aspergillus steynii IBT 23096]
MDMDMGGMDHDMGGSCQISMLWNWNTIDACFLSSSWHITSKGMFAGSCIGVIVLVMALEFLRRLGREYDAFIINRARLRAKYLDLDPATLTSTKPGAGPAEETCCSSSSNNNDNDNDNDAGPSKTPAPVSVPTSALATGFKGGRGEGKRGIRPTPIEQTIRALLHMVQFAVAYFVMLLAMYFNGYIIICIFIGAFLGAMMFSWEEIGGNGFENDATAVTKCCG